MEDIKRYFICWSLGNSKIGKTKVSYPSEYANMIINTFQKEYFKYWLEEEII